MLAFVVQLGLYFGQMDVQMSASSCAVGVSSRPWYVVCINPQYALAASLRLSILGELYIPVYKDKLRRNDYGKAQKFRTVEKPLFPGYVFINFYDFEGDRQKLATILGVISLLSFAGVPAEVTQREIDNLRELVASGLRPMDVPTDGDLVRIMIGTAEFEGTYSTANGKPTVSVHMFLRPVGVPVEDTAKIKVISRAKRVA